MKKPYQFGFALGRHKGLTDPVREGIEKHLGKLDEIYGRARADAEDIQRSRRYTSEGKVTALAELAEKVADEVRAERTTWNGYLQNIKQIEASIHTVGRPLRADLDGAAGAVRAWELRDKLAAMDPLEVEGIYRAAVLRGDRFVTESMENGVLGPLVKQELIDKLAHEKLAVAHPEEAAKIAELRIAHSELTAALKTMMTVLREEDLIVQLDDQLADAAGSKAA